MVLGHGVISRARGFPAGPKWMRGTRNSGRTPPSCLPERESRGGAHPRPGEIAEGRTTAHEGAHGPGATSAGACPKNAGGPVSGGPAPPYAPLLRPGKGRQHERRPPRRAAERRVRRCHRRKPWPFRMPTHSPAGPASAEFPRSPARPAHAGPVAGRNLAAPRVRSARLVNPPADRTTCARVTSWPADDAARPHGPTGRQRGRKR